MNEEVSETLVLESFMLSLQKIHESGLLFRWNLWKSLNDFNDLIKKYDFTWFHAISSKNVVKPASLISHRFQIDFELHFGE